MLQGGQCRIGSILPFRVQEVSIQACYQLDGPQKLEDITLGVGIGEHGRECAGVAMWYYSYLKQAVACHALTAAV